VLLSTAILYGTLLACAIVAAWIARQYDLYDLEPWRVLLLATALGAAGMYAAGQVQGLIIRRVTDRGVEFTDTMLALLAGSVEEAFKFASVVVVAVLVRRKFNEPLDGLVYGSFAGLGAAIEESVWVLRHSESLSHLPPQEPIRLAGHLVMGGIGCFGLGVLTAKRRRWHAVWAIPVCFAAAFGLHALWDIAAFDAAESYRDIRELRGWHTAVPVVLMLAGLGAYKGLAAWGAALTRAKNHFCDVRTRACPAPEATDA
jgi:RsiW-degrading membrane proteinase PrsW (M82 family)